MIHTPVGVERLPTAVRLPVISNPHETTVACSDQGLKPSCWTEVLRGAAPLAVDDALQAAMLLPESEVLPNLRGRHP